MTQSVFKKTFSNAAAMLCIAACIADVVLIYIFGNQIPGYNQLTSTLSSLGISTSPVAREVTVWSVTLGLIFIVFAYGFLQVFRKYGKETRMVFWLILLYGMGENIASGIFRADRINGELTNLAILHDLLGGIGVIALLLLPLVMQRIFTQFSFPLFYRYSRMAWLVGIIAIVLFSFRLNYFTGSFLHTYSGVWQRIFLINYYIYFTVMAAMVIRENNSLQTKMHKN
jgi:hypothetical protein